MPIFDENTSESWLTEPEEDSISAELEIIDDRYRVEAVLGRGAMGVVYLAHELALDRPVAIKRVASSYSSDPKFVQLFVREAKAMARIRHENVVQVYTFGVHRDAHYLAMEFVEGTALEHILAESSLREERMQPEHAVRMLARIIDGAAAIHKAGLVHGDLKPANIVIEKGSGRPVIIDFGVATNKQIAREMGLAGSPGYVAPERCKNPDAISERSDVYSLGCTAFELLSGEQVYEASSVAEMLDVHMHAPIPRVSKRVPDLKPFDAILMRALAKRPEDRFAGCEEMAAALMDTEAHWSRRLPRISSVAPRPSQEGIVRVLVVDDDEAFARLAVRAAQLAFFRQRVSVKRLSSGSDAIEYASEHTPHLLLLDARRPETDAVATVAQLRNMDGGDDMRVVVMGAADELRRRFAPLGVQSFLAKPVDISTLVETIADIAKRCGWVREHSEPPASENYD